MSAAIFSVAALALIGPASAQPASGERPVNQCFSTTLWDGAWKATPDAKTIYLRAGAHQIWRVDLGDSCPALNRPDARLITASEGGEICAPLSLRVSDANGFSMSCVARNISHLTDNEAKALPPHTAP
jgi:hypothetical protein